MANGVNLGKAYVQIIPSAEGISGSISSALGSEMTAAGKAAGLNIAGGIGTALKGAATAVGAAAAVATGAIVKGSADVAAYGDNIDKMSQKMGISAQAYQEWDAVMQHSGTSIDIMQRGMTTLSKAVENGSDAFSAIGISAEELKSLSQEDLFAKTIEGLQNMESGTERTVLAQKLLGGSAKELGALLNTSAKDTQAMRDRVRELGGVMSDEAVKASAQFQDNIQDLQTAISGLGRNMISGLLPSLNDIVSGFTSLIAGEEGAEQKLSSGFTSLFSSLDGIVQGFLDSVTKLMPSILSGLSNILPEIISRATELIISLANALVDALPELITTIIPALASAAIQVVIALGSALIEAAPELMTAGVTLFEMLKESFVGSNLLEVGTQVIQNILNGITASLPGLLNTGVDIITNIANGLLNALPGLVATAGDIIVQFASFLMQNMPAILSAGTDLLLNLINGIINALPKIVTTALQVVVKLVAALAQNYPTIIKAGVEMIIKLVQGLTEAIPKILAAIVTICKDVAAEFVKYDWIGLGKNIIQGIIDGVVALGDALIQAILKLCSGALDAVKKFFGIASPSKVMANEVGKYIPEGIALGIEQNADVVTDAMEDIKADALSAAATMDISTTPRFNDSSMSQTAILARMDAMLTLMERYFPEMATEGMTITEINRRLGVAYS